MPRLGASGIKGLFKRHHCEKRPADPTKCDCQWRGKSGKYDVVLATWARCELDPRVKGAAVIVLNRFLVAASNPKTFDPAGERPSVGDKQTLAAFIEEWNTHYAKEYELSSNSLASMLGMLARGRLGGMSLEELAGAKKDIAAWLNEQGKTRKWKGKTWNTYHDLLNSVLKQAVLWDRMTVNPMPSIARKVPDQPEHFKERHLIEDVEDRLFAVVDQLNRPQHKPNRNKLTQDKADTIRQELAAGHSGKTLAAKYGVSPAIISSVKHGDIWNPDAIKPGTKGKEMRRRLIGAFDGGLRAGEMMRVQLPHVKWTKVNGAYEIALPPTITKGGKTTGETEYVFAATQRFIRLLEERRFALRNNPPSRQFVFGTEDGKFQKGFRRLWRELFTLAGLTWGRGKGLVWHTTRHEFISRLAENTKDPVLTQELARHRDLETTQGYFHTRRDKRLAAAAGLERGR